MNGLPVASQTAGHHTLALQLHPALVQARKAAVHARRAAAARLRIPDALRTAVLRAGIQANLQTFSENARFCVSRRQTGRFLPDCWRPGIPAYALRGISCAPDADAARIELRGKIDRNPLHAGRLPLFSRCEGRSAAPLFVCFSVPASAKMFKNAKKLFESCDFL